MTSLELQAQREALEERERLDTLCGALCDAELDLERLKLTALRLRAVVLAAREFAPVGNPVMFQRHERALISALHALDNHDAHHGVHAHLDEAKRRGLPTYDGEK